MVGSAKVVVVVVVGAGTVGMVEARVVGRGVVLEGILEVDRLCLVVDSSWVGFSLLKATLFPFWVTSP